MFSQASHLRGPVLDSCLGLLCLRVLPVSAWSFLQVLLQSEDWWLSLGLTVSACSCLSPHVSPSMNRWIGWLCFFSRPQMPHCSDNNGSNAFWPTAMCYISICLQALKMTLWPASAVRVDYTSRNTTVPLPAIAWGWTLMLSRQWWGRRYINTPLSQQYNWLM